MPIYISRGRFTTDAIKGMMAKPENREEAVSKLFESVGGQTHRLVPNPSVRMTGWSSENSLTTRRQPLPYWLRLVGGACPMSKRPLPCQPRMRERRSRLRERRRKPLGALDAPSIAAKQFVAKVPAGSASDHPSIAIPTHAALMMKPALNIASAPISP